MTRTYTIAPDVARARARKGGMLKHDPAADTAGVDAELAAAKLAEAIRRTVDSAGPLDQATRDRLALLLRGGDAA